MPETPDLAAVTAAQQRTWADGDFSMVASMITFVAENLAEALAILPDERVLDVACGSGNGAIAISRRTTSIFFSKPFYRRGNTCTSAISART